FIDWAQNPEIKNAFTENFVKIGEVINALPDEIDKYVVVNESGTPVPFPDGVSTSAQTIMFIERMEYGKLRAIYLNPNQLDQIRIANNKIVIVPMKFNDDILNELKTIFPGGKMEISNNVKIFWINPIINN
ncbi:hypothetical protein KJ591_01415, partial [Patescibacteria group bacterium]|nr:hypothetical protein [Patescibacteria group bacterium]